MTTTSILDVLDDPHLLGASLQQPATFSAWRTFLRSLFGLPIPAAEMALFTAATGRTVAPTARASEAYIIAGRRSRKTLMLSAVAVYLAAFVDWRSRLGPGEQGLIPLIAVDRRQARIAKRYVTAFLRGSPMLAGLVERETADALDLTTNVSIEIMTASYRGTRGYSIVAALLDEAAFLPTDDTAEPDREIVNALIPGMATTGGMLLVASSPWRKQGILYDARRRHWGVNDSAALVWHSDSRTMNPLISQAIIDGAVERDAASASSEWLAQFRDDLTDFVDRAAVEACVEPGIRERAPIQGEKYLSFTDPSGGSSDSMTCAIGHVEAGIVVLDVVREIPAPFDPESAVREFAELFGRYGITETTGDAYGAQWVASSFERRRIQYRHSELNRSQIYLNTLPRIMSRTVRLLDHPRMVNQLCGLERKTTRGGRDSIDHRPNASDDVANAVAGLCAVVMADESLGEFSTGFTGAAGGPVAWRDSPRERYRVRFVMSEAEREAQRRENELHRDRSAR